MKNEARSNSEFLIRHSEFAILLANYKRELLKWNERINLIGPEAPAAIAILRMHVRRGHARSARSNAECRIVNSE